MHSRMALAGLLALDGLLIAIFFAHHAAAARGSIPTVPDLFKINARDSVGTVLLFVKFFAGGVVLQRAARRTSAGWVAGLAAVLFLLWFDDWAEVHEFFGDALVKLLGLTAVGPLDPDDIGEVVYLIPFGILCFGLVLRALCRARQGVRREISGLLAALVLLAFFGAIADLIAQAARHLETDGAFDPAVLTKVIEDGGEMVAGSLLFWFAARVAHVQTSATARPVGALQTD